MGNVSSVLVETSDRIGCLDKKECRVFLDCTDKDGDIFQGSLDSDSKDARDQDSIGDGATVSLSASDIKTITGPRQKEREIAPCAADRSSRRTWSSTDPVDADATAYRSSAAGKARIQFHVGESDTPIAKLGCLADRGREVHECQTRMHRRSKRRRSIA